MIYLVASGIPAILVDRHIMKMFFYSYSSCRIPFRGTLVNTLQDGAACCLRPSRSDSQYFVGKTIFKLLVPLKMSPGLGAPEELCWMHTLVQGGGFDSPIQRLGVCAH